MSYQLQATETFWKEFYALRSEQKESVRAKWQTFKLDPFQPSLGTHIIWPLSAIARHPIRSVVIEGDLRVLFRIDGNMVTTLNVGTHKIYRFDPTIAATAIGILAEPFASRRLAKNGLH